MKKANRIAQKIYPLMGGLLTVLAVSISVNPASVWGLYQPKAPKRLK